MIGGHASMWGELVDVANFFGRVWPRASAVAERLWSRKEDRDFSDMRRRHALHRCRLVRRGFAVNPFEPGFCEDELPFRTPEVSSVF